MARLRTHWLLIALPTFYFLIIFWPAIFEGKVYGNLPNQQKLSIELENYKVAVDVPRDAPLGERLPQILHPDYHLLYEPANREIQNAFRHGRLPLYNPHRLLGTPLWGSPVADPANPLDLLLLFLSTNAVQLIKLYLYTLIGFAGTYWAAVAVFDSRRVPALTGASMYVLSPFAYYMYHWSNIYGVMALVPAIFCAAHLYLTGPRFRYLALLQFLTAWALVINQVQALLYFGIFFAFWLLLALALRVYAWRTAIRRLAMLGIAAAGGAALTWGFTRFLLERAGDLARNPHTLADLATQRPFLVDLNRLFQMWMGAGILSFWHYDAALIFFPITIVALWIAAAAVGWRQATRCRIALAIALGAIGFHCLIRPLDAALYWIHLPLYNLNWERWRAIYLFYLCLGWSVAAAMTMVFEAKPASTAWMRGRRIALAGLFFVAAWACLMLSALIFLRIGSGGAFPLAAAVGFVILGLGLRRGFSEQAGVLFAATIVGACLYLPATRVPFYTRTAVPASAPVGPRTMRLLDLSALADPSWEFLWYNDAPLAMFGMNGVTGYDTALEKSEARLFSVFASPQTQAIQRTNPDLKFGIASSIAWPDAKGVLTAEGGLTAINEARLRVLGVRDLLWKRPIPGPGEPAWNATFREWQSELADSSPINFLFDPTAVNLASLFQPDASDAAARRILEQMKPVPLRYDEASGAYETSLPGGPGGAVIAFHIGRFYRAYLNGAPVAFDESSNSPLLFVKKPSSNPATLILRPDTGPIWRAAIIGLALGLALLAACYWIGRRVPVG
jgi:hypothetical protein